MSQSSSELYKWLKTQEAAGTRDSSGEFTLERGRAWKKLGSFQLPFAEAWILKVVQAAFASVDSHIWVLQTREESIFRIDRVSWGRGEVEEAVFNLADEDRRDVAHLAVALRVLVQRGSRPFSVQYPDGEHWGWNGEKFVELPSELDADGLFQLTVANFEFGDSKSIFSLSNTGALAFRAEVSKVISEHCHLARRSIKIDGREVASFLNDPNFGVTDSSRPLILLRAPEAPDLPSFSIAEPEEFEAEPLGTHTVLLPDVTREVRASCSAAALISAFVEARYIRSGVSYYDAGSKKSEILWLRDGVVVQREPFLQEGSLGMAAIISAEGLKTDLSGLVPRRGKAKKERLKQGLRLLHQELTTFQNELGPDGFNIEHERWRNALTGLAGGVLLFVIPIFGVALLTKASYDYSSANRRAEYLDDALDQGLERLVESLGRKI